MKNKHAHHPMGKIILFIFSLLAVTSSYSQVTFGIKSGINIATTKDLIAYPINRVGWYVGGLSQLSINKKLFVQPELLYSTKGHRYVNYSFNNKTAIRLNYIAVPIMLGYRIDRRASLMLGPEFDYLMSVHQVLSNKENFNVSENYPRKFDIGLDVGLSYTITKNIGAEVRYNYGFKHMYNTDALGIRRGELLGGNRVFQIGLYHTLHK